MDRDSSDTLPGTTAERRVPVSTEAEILATRERVLLCAVREDAEAAARLAGGLARRGFIVDSRLLDAEDMEGERFAKLERAIRASDFCVVLLSRRAVPAPSRPVPILAAVFHAVSRLRAYALYLIPVRLEPVEQGDLGAASMELIDLFPDPEEGEAALARAMVTNYGRWDLESRHFLILGFGTVCITSILLLATLVLPPLIRADRPLRSVLLVTASIVLWLYPTFLASAWAGNRLGEWARRHRLAREWAWRGFVGAWTAVAALLLLL